MTAHQGPPDPSIQARWRPRGAITVITTLALTLGAVLIGASGAQATTTAETTSTTAGWAGWSPLPGYTSTADAPATVNYQGKHYVFTRGTDNRIHHNIFDGYSWTG